MKLTALIGVAAALALAACGTTPSSTSGGSTAASGSNNSYRIGIATIVSHPALDAAAAGFKEAMAEAGVEVSFDEQNAQGDQSTLTNIANTFAASDYDGF